MKKMVLLALLTLLITVNAHAFPTAFYFSGVIDEIAYVDPSSSSTGFGGIRYQDPFFGVFWYDVVSGLTPTFSYGSSSYYNPGDVNFQYALYFPTIDLFYRKSPNGGGSDIIITDSSTIDSFVVADGSMFDYPYPGNPYGIDDVRIAIAGGGASFSSPEMPDDFEGFDFIGGNIWVEIYGEEFDPNIPGNSFGGAIARFRNVPETPEPGTMILLAAGFGLAVTKRKSMLSKLK